MAEYDNRNSGIAGKPWPEQRLLLNGKLNVMGEDMQVVIVTAETNTGEKRLEIFQKIGVLFSNDKNGNDKAPDYSGPLDGLHQDWRIAGWRRFEQYDLNLRLPDPLLPRNQRLTLRER